MWRSLAILVLCFVLKAQFVLGAEIPKEGDLKLIATSTEQAAIITPEKEIKVAMTTTESYEMADAASVLGTKHRQEVSSANFALYPMIGTSLHNDGWKDVVSNSYIVGVGVEVPAASWLGIAIEGSFGDYDLRYQQFATGILAYHNFSLYTGSALAKIYFADGWLRPYVGGGIDALYFEGQAVSGRRSPFSRWVGASTAVAGADFELARNLAIGARASFSQPLLNTPTAFDPLSAYPEGNVMKVSYFRFMANLRVGI